MFPLSLLLPNFISLGGIFLRYGSIGTDLSSLEAGFVVGVFLISLALFSFALVGINLIIKSQRTLIRLTHYEKEKIEVHTLQLFTLFLSVFVLSFIANLFLYDTGLASSFGLLFSLLLSLAILFAPQAMVIEESGLSASIRRSLSLSFLKFPYLIAFLAIACFLVLFVSFFFLLFADFRIARFLAVIVNALLVLPFLEVLKTQIYLSKYTLLK